MTPAQCDAALPLCPCFVWGLQLTCGCGRRDACSEDGKGSEMRPVGGILERRFWGQWAPGACGGTGWHSARAAAKLQARWGYLIHCPIRCRSLGKLGPASIDRQTACCCQLCSSCLGKPAPQRCGHGAAGRRALRRPRHHRHHRHRSPSPWRCPRAAQCSVHRTKLPEFFSSSCRLPCSGAPVHTCL
jgi:hypothetical protein